MSKGCDEVTFFNVSVIMSYSMKGKGVGTVTFKDYGEGDWSKSQGIRILNCSKPFGLSKFSSGGISSYNVVYVLVMEEM